MKATTPVSDMLDFFKINDVATVWKETQTFQMLG
jgi:hypothetical protein